MYQSLFGFHNREAQIMPITAKPKASPSPYSRQIRDGVSYNPPPAYSKLPSRQRVAVVLTSGTKSLLGTKLLLALRELHIESHLIVSRNAQSHFQASEMQDDHIYALADKVHSAADFDTAVFQGMLPLDAMVVVPCDNRTLGSIATGLGDDMITRVARLMLARHQGLALISSDDPSTKTYEKYLTKVTKEGGLVLAFGSKFGKVPVTVDEFADEIVRSMLKSVVDSSLPERTAQK